MAAEMIEIGAAGSLLGAYLALPEAGSGPGVVLLHTAFGLDRHIRGVADLYAEEGYVVLCPDLYWRIAPGLDLGQNEADRRRMQGLYAKFDRDAALADIAETVGALRGRVECTGKIGAVGFCLGGGLAWRAAALPGVDCAVAYYGVGIDSGARSGGPDQLPDGPAFRRKRRLRPGGGGCPGQASRCRPPGLRDLHLPRRGARLQSAGRRRLRQVGRRVGAFALDRACCAGSWGRATTSKRLWEAHTTYEFGTRDVDATMATMVAEPYVNHIPVMTGGVGARELARFYANHFIPKLPADTRLVPISRTVGADSVVDEMLLCFTHDTEIDFMLPGVPPTGRYVEAPTVAIVKFRGDKLCHEHIYWDQASVLVQIGLLDPAGLPVAGGETARKLVDETRPSNALMKRWAESAGR